MLQKMFQLLGILFILKFYAQIGVSTEIICIKLTPEKSHAHATRNIDSTPCLKIRQNFFKNSSFLLQSLNGTI